MVHLICTLSVEVFSFVNADLGIFRSLFAPLSNSRPRLNHALLPHYFFFKVNFSKNKQGDFVINADLGIFRSFAPLNNSIPRLNHARLPHYFFFEVNFSKNKQGDVIIHAVFSMFRTLSTTLNNSGPRLNHALLPYFFLF